MKISRQIMADGAGRRDLQLALCLHGPGGHPSGLCWG